MIRAELPFDSLARELAQGIRLGPRLAMSEAPAAKLQARVEWRKRLGVEPSLPA
jgi:hypothetical protein